MIYLKQYGQYRTGTNYLKALVERNLDIRVLSNLLGHKHSQPVDWNRNCHGSRVLAHAVRHNLIRVVISIKEPYGSVYSYIPYRGMSWSCKRERLEPLVHDYCILFNQTYAAWFAMRARKRVICYEELISAPDATVRSLATWTNASTRSFRDVSNRVEKGDRHSSVKHNREFWINRRYMKRLPAWAVRNVNELIDWNLFSEYYGPTTT